MVSVDDNFPPVQTGRLGFCDASRRVGADVDGDIQKQPTGDATACGACNGGVTQAGS